jgi:glucokinase
MSAPPDLKTALLADIGGTNARFALAQKGAPEEVITLAVADYPTAYDAAGAALERLGAATRPGTAVLAFAGPVADGCSTMTNAGWNTTAEELRRRFGFGEVRLLNDYAALALSLAHLGPPDFRLIGPQHPDCKLDRRKTLAVLGPGSGLGVAALLPGRPHPLPLVTEGGHATMAAADSEEAALLDLLRGQLGHVSAERLLSGPGLVNLFEGLAALRRLPAQRLTAAEITQAAVDGSDELCRVTLEHFCRLLGCFAGNVALTFGATGGVFLGGGILPRFPDFLAASGFRARFEEKGRFTDYLAAIPTALITRPDAAFLGLAAAARQLA